MLSVSPGLALTLLPGVDAPLAFSVALMSTKKMHKILKISELNLHKSNIITTFIVPNNTPL